VKAWKIGDRTLGDNARLGLLDRCALRVHELPAAVLSNEDAGPAALLVYRSILVLSLGGGAIGHDRGSPVDADFDLIRDERIKIDAPALAILQVLHASLDVP